jgi:hypothetical protein
LKTPRPRRDEVGESIERDDLARRPTRLSKEQKFRFDVGQYVTDGFRHADQKDPGVRALLDKDRPRKKAERLSK